MQNQKLLQKDQISSLELESLLKARGNNECDFILVDVREIYEYEEEHIEGVDLLRPTSRFQDWAKELIDLSKDNTIILTCRTGNRTGQVQRILKGNGAKSIIDHQGGIMGWHNDVIYNDSVTKELL